MNSLDQYLRLFAENREVIDSNSAPLLNSRREEACAILREGARLPRKGDEGFEKTDIEKIYAPDYGVNLQRINIPVDVAASFRCDVPNMSTLLGITVNDSFHPTATLAGKLPEGVLFCSLREAAIKHPAIVERYYGRLAPMSDPAVALNTMLLQDGVMIYVPKGVRIEKPLQLVNIFSAPTPLLAFRRLVVAVEEGAALQLIVCDHTQDHTENPYLSSQVVEISVGRDAVVDYCDIEESSPHTSRYSKMYARQDASSKLTVNGVTLTNGVTRNEFEIDIAGEHCETRLAGMAVGSGRQHIDNRSDVEHLAPRCHSNQLFKYVLTDQAQGAFEGGIHVTPAAPFTEAYQSNRNMLDSREARMHTMPQLLIYNDDVKCSHGATTGQLDNEALFYMRSRGIPEKEARTMLMQAFMSDVIDTIHITGLQERMRHLVEKRFANPEAFCGECGASCRHAMGDRTTND